MRTTQRPTTGKPTNTTRKSSNKNKSSNKKTTPKTTTTTTTTTTPEPTTTTTEEPTTTPEPEPITINKTKRCKHGIHVTSKNNHSLPHKTTIKAKIIKIDPSIWPLGPKN
uniref:Uncharacterized protein n=1 Tax=Cacopsylla melanoneura TaxID=428564 RepID=A0A8D8YJN9_9HEMI